MEISNELVRNLAKHASRLMITLLLGGFLGATLVRFAPGYGADEEDLDTRLSSDSKAALRQDRTDAGSLPRYYRDYLVRLLHGDLGTSVGLREPCCRLACRNRIRLAACRFAFSALSGLPILCARRCRPPSPNAAPPVFAWL